MDTSAPDRLQAERIDHADSQRPARNLLGRRIKGSDLIFFRRQELPGQEDIRLGIVRNHIKTATQ